MRITALILVLLFLIGCSLTEKEIAYYESQKIGKCALKKSEAKCHQEYGLN